MEKTNRICGLILLTLKNKRCPNYYPMYKYFNPFEFKLKKNSVAWVVLKF